MLEFDLWLFRLLNNELTNPFFDWAMPVITNQKNWIPFLLIFLGTLIFAAGGKYRVFALALCLSTGFSDYLSAGIIKKTVKRQRPCCDLADARKLTGCSTGKSFPSAHAANSTNLACMVWYEFGLKVGIPGIIAALIVGYSRIYVGVHYPVDVFAGTLVGILSAIIFYNLKRKFHKVPPERD